VQIAKTLYALLQTPVQFLLSLWREGGLAHCALARPERCHGDTLLARGGTGRDYRARQSLQAQELGLFGSEFFFGEDSLIA
jgi:hypothetical protein